MPSALSLRLVVLAAASAAAASCPSSDWHQYRDMCYWMSNYTLNGRSVEPVCRSLTPGAESVSIHDLDLNAFIAEDLTRGEWARLGLTRADPNSDWKWNDGSPLNFTIWHEGEPGATDVCGSINWRDMGFWSAESCDTHYLPFVCQVNA